jgi:hypothetical protein
VAEVDPVRAIPILAAHALVAMAIERAEVDGLRGAAGRAVTHKAAQIVGENSIGMRFAWRSFQAPVKRSASSST